MNKPFGICTAFVFSCLITSTTCVDKKSSIKVENHSNKTLYLIFYKNAIVSDTVKINKHIKSTWDGCTYMNDSLYLTVVYPNNTSYSWAQCYYPGPKDSVFRMEKFLVQVIDKQIFKETGNLNSATVERKVLTRNDILENKCSITLDSLGHVTLKY